MWEWEVCVGGLFLAEDSLPSLISSGVETAIYIYMAISTCRENSSFRYAAGAVFLPVLLLVSDAVVGNNGHPTRLHSAAARNAVPVTSCSVLYVLVTCAVNCVPQ